MKCGFTSTETVGLLGTGSPGRPPRLSHSSWTMVKCNPSDFYRRWRERDKPLVFCYWLFCFVFCLFCFCNRKQPPANYFPMKCLCTYFRKKSTPHTTSLDNCAFSWKRVAHTTNHHLMKWFLRSFKNKLPHKPPLGGITACSWNRFTPQTTISWNDCVIIWKQTRTKFSHDILLPN